MEYFLDAGHLGKVGKPLLLGRPVLDSGSDRTARIIRDAGAGRLSRCRLATNTRAEERASALRLSRRSVGATRSRLVRPVDALVTQGALVHRRAAAPSKHEARAPLPRLLDVTRGDTILRDFVATNFAGLCRTMARERRPSLSRRRPRDPIADSLEHARIALASATLFLWRAHACDGELACLWPWVHHFCSRDQHLLLLRIRPSGSRIRPRALALVFRAPLEQFRPSLCRRWRHVRGPLPLGGRHRHARFLFEPECRRVLRAGSAGTVPRSLMQRFGQVAFLQGPVALRKHLLRLGHHWRLWWRHCLLRRRSRRRLWSRILLELRILLRRGWRARCVGVDECPLRIGTLSPLGPGPVCHLGLRSGGARTRVRLWFDWCCSLVNRRRRRRQ